MDYITINRALNAVRAIKEDISFIYEEEKAVEPPNSPRLVLLSAIKSDLYKAELNLGAILKLGSDDMGRITILNLSTVKDEVAVYLVYCWLSKKPTTMFRDLGIEIKH